MKIAIIAHKYPTEENRTACVFIQQLVWTFADLGCDCVVINPIAINTSFRSIRAIRKARTERTESGAVVEIRHPLYINFGQTKQYGSRTLAPLTVDAFTLAVDQELQRMNGMPDVLYAHFIIPAGISASRLGRKYQLPAFFAHGEALFVADKKMGGIARLKEELSNISGVIAVSGQNRDYLVDRSLVDPAAIGVFPNGFRPERFFKRDKSVSRSKFDMPKDAFIVGYCGRFDYEKGVKRLEEAVDSIEHVLMACAGSGELAPVGRKCIMASSVNNEDLPYFYSAIDVFVLPTLCEGCSNAIVEAVACGCPVISADLPFNYDILDHSNSLLINPNSVDEIREAIVCLRDNAALREQLGCGSEEKAKGLTLRSRAANIVDFMKNKSGLSG